MSDVNLYRVVCEVCGYEYEFKDKDRALLIAEAHKKGYHEVI